jgi:hypothetical protein
MAEKDTVVFLDFMEGAVHSIRGDGSNMQKLFTKDCVCPDGLAIDLNEYKNTKDQSDIVVWWSNMGEKKLAEGERDGGDWHAADGFPVRAALYGGDEAAEQVEVKGPSRLIRGGAPYEAAKKGPLITTMKQVALTQDGKSLFFCDREGHCVKKYNVDTHEVVPLVSIDALLAVESGIPEERAFATPVKPNSDEDKSRMCVGIALDEPHNQIFFTIKGPSKGGKGRILAAPYHFKLRNLPSLTAAKSSAAEGIIDPHHVATLHRNLPEPIDLLLDGQESYLYWTDRGDDAMGGNSLNRSKVTYLRNGQPQLGPVEILIAGFTEAIGVAWPFSHRESIPVSRASNDSLRKHMYVTDKGHVWRCDVKEKTKLAIYECSEGHMFTGVEAMRLE